MSHDVQVPRNFEDPSRHSRIDLALMNKVPETNYRDFEIALASGDNTFTDVVYREGLPVTVLILYRLDSKKAKGVTGYKFEDQGHGWQVSERIGHISQIDDLKFNLLPDLTEEHVDILEQVVGSSEVVGFSKLNPNRQQQIDKIKKGAWSVIANTLVLLAQKAGSKAGHRDDADNRVPGVKPSRLER